MTTQDETATRINGLTKREYFAAMAMTALLRDKSVDVAAKLSVKAADALLSALTENED